MPIQNALWDQLTAEFPPLWNPQDLCFRDLHVRNQCRHLLLEKVNRVSSVPITMESLRNRLKYVARRLRKGSYQESLVTPVMGTDSLLSQQDVNGDMGTQHLTTTQKLPTENQEPEEKPPTPRRFRRLEDLMQEFPSVWDREAPGYFDRRAKKITFTKLLHKYNSMRTESYRINYSQLRTRIESIKRRKRRKALAAAQARRSEDTRADWQSDLGISFDSTDHQANLNTQAPILSIVYLRCAVCGEVKSERLNHNDKSYIDNNKTTLTFNNLSVELSYDKDASVCQNCDKKLKEMHEFVKLVKNAQDKMNGVNVADVIILDDDDNDDQKLTIDSVTVTDTEVTPRVSHKRKSEETPELKKRCRVTIDLNSCDDNRSMDDIAKYRMFKNDGIIVDANDPEKVLKVIGTGYGEDITFNVKEEIDTDDIHEEVDETGDVSTDDDKSNIVIADTRTCNSEDVIKQKEAEDVLKNVETSNTVTQEEKRKDIDGNGEVVNKEDNRNGIINEHTNESEITGAAASIVNAFAIKEPVCVMPKSELIGLVESIVTRMLNK